MLRCSGQRQPEAERRKCTMLSIRTRSRRHLVRLRQMVAGDRAPGFVASLIVELAARAACATPSTRNIDPQLRGVAGLQRDGRQDVPPGVAADTAAPAVAVVVLVKVLVHGSSGQGYGAFRRRWARCRNARGRRPAEVRAPGRPGAARTTLHGFRDPDVGRPAQGRAQQFRRAVVEFGVSAGEDGLERVGPSSWERSTRGRLLLGCVRRGSRGVRR